VSRTARQVADPDRVLRTAGHYALLGCVSVVGAIGVLTLALVGADPALALGAGLVLLAAAGARLLSAPSHRRPLPPAVAGDDCVLLPVRRGYDAAGTLAMVALVVMGVGALLSAEAADTVVTGVVLVVIGAVLAVVTLRHDHAIRLDPDGVTLPGGRGGARRVAWDEVDDVVVVAGVQPRLVVLRDGPGTPSARLLAQAWPPSTLLAVLTAYRRQSNRRDRAGLVDPATLDRFRGL
jgi:hypothetical protein